MIESQPFLMGLILLLAINGLCKDQPQWGQKFTRNMVSSETGLPDAFDPNSGKNIKWRIPLGTQTYSTPVISGGKVFIGTNNDNPRDNRHKGDRGVLFCLNEKDGSLNWQLVVPKLTYDAYWDWAKEGIVSPATVEGDRVYLVSNRGEVMCLDVNGQLNGNDGPFMKEGQHMAPRPSEPMEMTRLDADIIWLYDMIGELGIRQHDAAHSSILLDGSFLYINTSNGVDNTHRNIRSPEAPSLIVLDKNTGKLVAQDDEKIGPRIFHCTWSSPSLGVVDGIKQIFFAGGDGILYAFQALKALPQNKNLKKLDKIWWFDGDPSAPKENVHQYTKNRKQSPSNVKSMPVVFQNKIFLTLGGDIWWGKQEAWLKCVDIGQNGNITGKGEIWSYPLERHACSTPSVFKNMVFVTDLGQNIHCVDVSTGLPFWVDKTGGDFWASTLVADGKVYAGNRAGEFFVFEASENKKLISSVKLDSPISATPVAANGVLYIATNHFLYAVQEKK